MKIARIDAIAVGLPMKKPVKMAGVLITRADNVLARVETDNGVVGWGEAGSAPLMTGETVESMVAAVRYMAPMLIERNAEDIEGASAAMNHGMYGNKAAKATIEIALHDLVGKALGRPAYALLGEKRRDRIPAMATIGTGSMAGDVPEARELRAQGFVAFKIKVGVDTPEADGERTARICDALGEGCTISADANQGYSVEEAIGYVRRVADTRLDFFEQPVQQDNLKGLAEIAAASRIAIGIDEGAHSLDDIERHHAARAARGFALKTIKLAGMRGVVEAGQLCAKLGLEINVSCKTGESSIDSSAALHTAAVLPHIRWGLSITNVGLAEDLVTRPLRIEEGHIEVPNAPGLGIEVDEEKVRKFGV